MRTDARSVLVGLGWVGAAAALLVLVFIGYCAVTLPASGGSTADETGPAIVFTAADGQVFAARGAPKGKGRNRPLAGGSGPCPDRDRGPALLLASRDRSSRDLARGLARFER